MHKDENIISTLCARLCRVSFNSMRTITQINERVLLVETSFGSYTKESYEEQSRLRKTGLPGEFRDFLRISRV